jgi:cell division transport system permease protein
MSAWIERHLQTLIGSLGRLSKQPSATFLTVLVMGIALALPACLDVLVSNAQQASGNWGRALDISMYLKASVDADAAARLKTKLAQRADIKAIELIKSDDALKEFREHSGFGDALDALKENPLPNLLVVTPADSLTPDALQVLGNELRGLPEADVVQQDTAWVQRYLAILDVVRQLVTLLAVLLAAGVIVIVGNTIRLDIQNRRDEIEVTKLVGGSDAFVRRPFLYAGFWYGLGGGVLAWLVTALVVLALAGPVRRIAGLYGSGFELTGLGFRAALVLVLVGIVLGWMGSYVATTRHLRDAEPR